MENNELPLWHSYHLKCGTPLALTCNLLVETEDHWHAGEKCHKAFFFFIN